MHSKGHVFFGRMQITVQRHGW